MSSGLAAAPFLGCQPDAPVAYSDLDAAAPDFSALQSALNGDLLLPEHPTFAQAAQTFHTRFDAVQPRAIARCADAADVQACVRWAQKYRFPVRIRAGGHSYAGFCKDSAALVIDVRKLNQVTLNSQLTQLKIGAGALTIDAQAQLWPNNLALPTGSCPTVGMAGLTLGGGYGLIARRFGLTCDALLAVDMVLATGENVTCNSVQNPDLYWASRGGGGGNFGVVTAFTYAVVSVSGATNFSLTWPWSEAARVLKAWQQWAPQTAAELTAECQLFAGSYVGATPRITVGGGFLGTPAELASLLAELYGLGAGKPLEESVDTGSYGAIARQWVDCDGVVGHCHLKNRSPEGQVARETYVAKSDYVKNPLPDAALEKIIAALEARVGSDHIAGIQFAPYGGAIAQIPATATAFVHRDALFVMQYLAFGAEGSPLGGEKNWLENVYQALRPYVSGQAYQNYVDPGLEHWREAYYGENLQRLQALKAKYDPTRFFDFAQAI